MAEHQSFLLRDDDGFEKNDEFTEPLRPQTRDDIQDAPPSAHMDRAWAIAFKINVAVTLISVSIPAYAPPSPPSCYVGWGWTYA